MSVPASPSRPRAAADPAVSNRRAEASRANGRKSAGPRTPEGKARSAMNALKHGASARLPLIPGDDPADRDAYVGDIIEDLAPADAVERDLAGRIAGLSWRRRRLWRAEQELIDVHFERLLSGEGAAEAEPLNQFDGQIFLAAQFKPARPTPLIRLSDYERRLSGSIDAALRMLLKLQDRRKKAERSPSEEPDAPVQNEPEASAVRSARDADDDDDGAPAQNEPNPVDASATDTDRNDVDDFTTTVVNTIRCDPPRGAQVELAVDTDQGRPERPMRSHGEGTGRDRRDGDPSEPARRAAEGSLDRQKPLDPDPA